MLSTSENAGEIYESPHSFLTHGLTRTFRFGEWSAATKSYSFANADEAYADMTAEMGIVPQFFKAYPPASIAGAWGEYKSVFLNPNTALRGATKELIGLAVSAQIPCRYCSYAHEHFAKANGATDQEVTEAVALAGLVRQWSTTFNGLQLDQARFRQDADRILRSKTTKKMSSTTAPKNLSTLADIQQTFGFVPGFIEAIPVASRDGAWQDVKALMFAPTKISAKEKSLIMLSVSAQAACTYCVYFDTKSAKMDGATTQEIQEALTVASLTRKWSTILNGMQIDEAKFRSEIDQGSIKS